MRRLALVTLLALALTAPAQNFETWVGKLKPPGGELTIVVNVKKGAQGKLSATLDSPDQSAKGIPLTKVVSDGKRLAFSADTIRASYEGRKTTDGNSASGKFKQAGFSFDLKLSKVAKYVHEAKRRPQTPMPPFPYDAEEVTVRNEAHGQTLAGTLTKPKGDGPFPTAVMITGSGSQDRDETIFEHKPFLVIADYLARRGIAVLRLDDRGTGKSTGKKMDATSADFALDVRCAVDYLKSRRDIDSSRIGLIGHSEGGMIGGTAAADDPSVAFVVMLAGTGVPGEEIVLAQQEAIMRANGISHKDAKEAVDVIKNALERVRLGETAEQIANYLYRSGLAHNDKLPKSQRQNHEIIKAAAKMQATQLTNAWMKFFLKYDPRPALSRVRYPVLALNGSKDLQILPSQNLPEIEKALKAGGNEQVRVRVFEGLNHLFQPCKTGSPAEYGKIETTFSPEALKVIGDWILETVGLK